MIDRERAIKTFLEYTSHYDPEDPKIRLKIDHSLRVAGLCEEIALSLARLQADADLAFLIGLVHDIGRFEQIRVYHTFRDAESIDHAALSCDLLFREGMIREYTAADKDDVLIERAVRLHSEYELPEDLSGTERMYCNILRDADKIDILWINIDTPPETVYHMSEEEFRNSAMSDQVYGDLLAHRNVKHAHKKTGIDYLAGRIALVFGLSYPASFRILREQGALEKTLEFESVNEETGVRMERIRQEVRQFVDDGLKEEGR